MSDQTELTDDFSSGDGQGGAAASSVEESLEIETGVESESESESEDMVELSLSEASSGTPAPSATSSDGSASSEASSSDDALSEGEASSEGSASKTPSSDGGAGRWKVAACVLAALLVILLALLGIRSCSQDGEFSYDSNAIQGQAPYKTAEELQAELNRIVDEGMFNISIASVIRFADGASAGTAYIENVPGNRYDMQVTITLDSDGSEVYRSGVLAPDSYIGDITLSQNLAAGEYDATATFTALNGETHEEEGKAAAKISLVVG